MELIERYLQAIGRALPPAQRADILSELRSSLYDALEGDENTAPDEAQVVALIKQMGPPQQVAAAYYPAGQYLIGPSLYPLFRTVLGIVFTVVIAVQLLGIAFALLPDSSTAALLDNGWDLVTSLAMALGTVVLIFWGLQRLKVQPEPAAFNPRDLPPLEPDSEASSRSSHVFSIIVSVVVLVFLARFAQRGSFAWVDGSVFFENPVISQYLPLIVLSSLVEIVLEIVVLWQGRWQIVTRLASVLINLFSLGVVIVLLQGHDAWLAAQGVAGLFTSIADIPALIIARSPLAGMVTFRAGLAFALVIVAGETISSLYQFVRALVRRSRPTGASWVAVENK
jgi:hypothetical protein